MFQVQFKTDSQWVNNSNSGEEFDTVEKAEQNRKERVSFHPQYSDRYRIVDLNSLQVVEPKYTFAVGGGKSPWIISTYNTYSECRRRNLGQIIINLDTGERYLP